MRSVVNVIVVYVSAADVNMNVNVAVVNVVLKMNSVELSVLALHQ